MARRPAPSFTPEQMAKIQDIQNFVINNPSSAPSQPAPQPVPITPQPGGMGMQSGKAGGFWYARGGMIEDDREAADLNLAGPRLPGMENVEEELGLPPEAGSDMLRRPGMKGYMDTKPQAKFGSNTCITCKDKFNAK